jgi:eukaryotic-like serine/threonine-protein kinase
LDAYAFAGIGDYEQAQSSAEAAATKNPESTEAKDIDLPLTLAEIDVSQNKPADAIAALQPTLPCELRDFWAPYLLGRAWLAKGSADNAAGQFRKILANRGVDGISPLSPLAWLGLARTLHVEGKNEASRAVYRQLFAFWKNTDEDLPVLLQARGEYSKL